MLEVHLVMLRLQDSNFVLLCFSEDKDGVLLDGRDCVLCLKDKDEAERYCHANGLILRTTSPNYDIDQVMVTLELKRRTTSEPITWERNECNGVINAWNLFSDVNLSLGMKSLGDSTALNDVYEKLFFGMNQPAITPEGQCYAPGFSKEELALLEKILNEYIQVFLNSVKPADLT